MTKVHICYQQDTLTGLFIKAVNQRQMYISVINKILQRDESWQLVLIGPHSNKYNNKSSIIT